MRLRTVLGTTAATLLLFGAGVGSAQAGERTGAGGDTEGPDHANSICVYSGLEDGEEQEGAPSGPGVPPQNWGHVQQAARDAGATPQDLKASGAQPGDSCNGHTGFLAGGGEEP
jgi:hypothetical protein